jgi:hypothetical protein
MLKIAERALPASATKVLSELQALVNEAEGYPARVKIAKEAWDARASTAAKAAAFRTVRSTLAEMCVGPVRCAYCEDSMADEVEHIRPKSLFPEIVFTWENYLFACGPCNGPKSNRYGVLVGDLVQEFLRRRGDPVVRPPAGPSALIDPRIEDPLEFLELDLGGVTPGGEAVEGTFDFLPAEGLGAATQRRALFTIEILGLNREVIRVARGNAFGGFRARLREYVEEKDNGASEQSLDRLRAEFLRTPHLTVYAEMRRQRTFLPEINDLFVRAPEALGWSLVPLH